MQQKKETVTLVLFPQVILMTWGPDLRLVWHQNLCTHCQGTLNPFLYVYSAYRCPHSKTSGRS